MSVTSIVLRNIKFNLKKYAMYLFSIAFSVFTYFTFVNLYNTREVITAYKNNSNVLALLKAFAVIILVFIVFFLWYSNRHFLKSRKKEIATYALFGMPYNKIGRLIMLENLIIGGVSTAIGLLFGILFSKLMTMLLLYMVNSELNIDVKFGISLKALMQTIVIFFTAFIVLGLNGYRVAYQVKLVELFKAEKLGDKKVKGSYILFIISIILISWGYYIATIDDAMKVASNTLTILGLTISGTYLFFYSGIPIIIRIIKKRKKYYYKGNNLLALTQFLYRIRSNTVMMATIAVLSAVAMTGVASTYGIYYSSEKFGYEDNIFDMYYINDGEIKEDTINEVFNSFSQHEITKDYYLDILTARGVMKKKNVEMYGENFEVFNKDGDDFHVISESYYNSLIKELFSYMEQVKIDDDKNCAYISSFIVKGAEEGLLLNNQITFDNGIKLSITNCLVQPGFDFNRRSATIVVSDDVYDKLTQDNVLRKAVSIRGIMYTKATRSRALVEKFKTVLPNDKVRFFYDSYSYNLSYFGIVMFIGIFMGIVFLLITASLLYFKQLSEAEYDKPYFNTLSKIGIDKNREKKIIGKQIFPVFMLPLLIGTIHSYFAMQSAETVIRNVDFTIPMIIMYGIYILIYGVFYVITKNQYFNVIENK